MTETTTVVGARFDDERGEAAGAAYVFERGTGSSWAQSAKLLGADTAAGDLFGHSVAIDGNRIVVGADNDGDLGAGSGSAYVFERSGTSWIQTAKLMPADGSVGDGFDVSVAVAGDIVVVGAHQDDDLGSESGSAYVFHLSAGAVWAQVQKLVASDGARDKYFGWSVSASGSDILVAGWHNTPTTNRGSAYVFEPGLTGWRETVKLEPWGAPTDIGFGVHCSLATGIAVVGAYVDDDLSFEAGSAYVFERGATGTWAGAAKLTASDGASRDLLGRSVAVSGSRILVGSYHDDDSGNESGSAYLFEKQAAAWNEVSKLVPADGATADQFGLGVALSERAALVGARLDDDGSPDSGSAYIFELGAPATTVYGCGVNPLGSITVLSGSPSIGTTVVFGIDNPLGTQAPGSAPILFIAGAPDTAFPCGPVVYGLGMAGPAAGGEVLISLPAFDFVGGAPWSGPGVPAPIAVAVPNDCRLIGARFYAQGVLLDLLGSLGVTVGLTDAVQLTIGS